MWWVIPSDGRGESERLEEGVGVLVVVPEQTKGSGDFKTLDGQRKRGE